MGWVVKGAVAGKCYKAEACLGYGASFSSRRVLFIDSGVRQGEGQGPEYGASAWVDSYARSAAKFQFVRGSAVAERAACAQGAGVAVVLRFEVFATHAGSSEVV